MRPPEGGIIVIERRGEPVAELRPITGPPRMPARQESADLRLACGKSGLECRKWTTARGSSKRIAADRAAVYLDTSYIAKFYFNEPESAGVRELVRKADAIHSSLWALAEFHAVIHRRLREGAISAKEALDLASRFSAHVEDGLWNLIPVHEALLRRTSALMVSAPAICSYEPPMPYIWRRRTKSENATCGPMTATCSLRRLISA